MKNYLFVILSVIISITGMAQEKSVDDKSESKTLEFMSQGSSLIKKEFYDLGKVKGVECQVLIITNLLSNERLGCLRLETKYQGYSSSETYVGTLDYDEIDDCLNSINFICENILTITPTVYTETEYRTRDNIEVGAYYSENKSSWTAYLYTKNYTNRSVEFFDLESLSSLAKIMQNAKVMIAEKVQ
ncbi:MAG: hypothetical protein IJZ87_02040 [Bacteroidales bacterium]|nr:hypothetical protein [Bacteroidales bacterium]